MTQDTPTKVLSTEELLKRFNAQKAGQVEPLKKDPWGYEPVDIDVMLGNTRNASQVSSTGTVTEDNRQGFFPYIGKKLKSSAMSLGEMVTEIPQAAEALINTPAVMLTESAIRRGVRRGEIDPDTGNVLLREAKTITPKISLGQNIPRVGVERTIGSDIADSDLNEWFEKNKTKFAEQATRYDKTAEEYIKSGQYGKALGAIAGGVAESLAPTIAAMFIPGGAAALGAGVAAQQYDEVKDREDMRESMKMADAVTQGIFEWLFERIGSREMAKVLTTIYKKSGKQGIVDAITSPGVKNLIAKGYKKLGVWFAPVHEGVSELLTTLGQNAAARISGEDPEREWNDGAWDSFLVGAGMGGMFAGVEKVAKKARDITSKPGEQPILGSPQQAIQARQQEDIDAVNQVRAKGREYTLGGFNDQDPGANVIRYADTRDKRKVIIISGKHIEGSGTIYTVRDANSPDAPVQMISEKDVVNTLNVPYEEWVQNELRQYHEIRNQVDSDMAKANAPVQEGQEITLENKSWIVTRVTPEGVTLNEISQEGNITGNIQQVTPDQYNNVFVAPPTDQAQETPAEQTAGQPITGTVQAEVPIPEAQQQARKISDGRNEFTVSPREDGNFQVAETFQTQKEAETTIKKLQALYPKLKWEYEMEDSGDYFTPDIYRVVAKIPRKKEVVQQPQAEATPIEQETPKIAPIETPIEAPAQTELQAQGQIENIEKQPPVVEQTAAPLTPGETVPVEAEMQEAGEVEIAEPREVEPEQKTERPANLQPISVFKPGDRIRNSAGDVWEVVEVPGDENKPAVLRDIQDGTTTDWNQKIASWTLEKKEESPEIQMMKANREVDPNPSEAQKEAGNYQKGHIKWQGMDITIETAPMTIRKGTDKSGKEWKQLMHNAYGYIRRTLGPKTEGKDQVDVFLGDNLESETVYVIDQVDPRTQLFDEPKTMIGFNSAEEASQAYLANYEPGWKGLGAITPMPVSEFKEWVFDRTKTSRPVDPSVKVKEKQEKSEKKDIQPKPGFAGEYLDLMTKRFLKASDGSKNFGVIRAETGLKEAPIRLTEGNESYGLQHIIQQHGEEIKAAGYKSVPAFVEEVAKNYTVIRAGAVYNNKPTYLLELADKHNRTLIVELSRSEDYWNVNSAGIFRKGYSKNKKVVWSLPALGIKQSAATDDVAYQPEDKSGTGKVSGDSPQTTSESKDTKKENTSQNVKSRNLEFAGEFLEKPPEPGPSVNLKIEPPAEPGEKALAPGKTEVDPQQVEYLAASKPGQRIEDFGEHIAGARKELRSQIEKHLDTTDEDLLNNSISKVLPPINYKELVNGGLATPEEAAFLQYFRSKIGPKPRSTFRKKRWLSSVNAYKTYLRFVIDKESFENISGGMSVMEYIKKNMPGYDTSEINEHIQLLLDLGFPNDVTSLKGYSLRFFERSKQEQYDKDNKLIPAPPDVWSIIAPYRGSKIGRFIVKDFPTREEAVAGLKYILNTESEKPGQVKFDMWRERGKEGIYIGKKIGARKYITLASGFDKVSEAKKYIKNHQEELEKMLEQKKIIPYERPEERGPRIGKDYREGENVTPEMFSHAFGFRGVQFGNYVEQLKRQEDLNEAYDALMDLSEILDLPSMALSLSGQLGIAFGARGRGGQRAPSAHYEPGEIVINLTKGTGAGSLAHEWFHAVDSYFSRVRGDKFGYITQKPIRLINKDGTKSDLIRPEVIEAFKNVTDAIHVSGLRQRSIELDKRRTKDYWSQPIEMAARSFEAYVKTKLSERDTRNDYLVSYRDIADYIIEAGGSENVYPYPTKEETETIFDAFDKLFQAIQTKEEGGRVVMYRATDELANINKEFNEQLDQFVKGKIKVGHTFELGNPGDILLSAGFPNLPIQLTSTKLKEKSTLARHPFDPALLKDLPNAIHNPIIVFRSATRVDSMVVLTEIQDKDKNFIVAIELSRDVYRNRRAIQVNDIRSVFPKETKDLRGWINDGLMEWIDKEKALDWLGRQRSNYAEAAIPTKDIAKIINTFKNPSISLENNNQFRIIGERGASRLSNAEKVLDGLRAAKEMESIGNIDKLKNVVLNLFHKASKGDISGKSIKIGNLTANGRDYLAELAGIDMKQYVSFVINPSDLRHIYNEHYGANEKDRGQNYPLIDEDIRNMVDVILNPEKIVSFKEDGITKFIFLAKSPQDGTYNLIEVYGDKRGNLSAKSIYNTKKDVSHRAMTIIKQSRLSTSKTSGAILSETNIPQLFESTKSFDAKTIRLATGWERGKDGKWRHETRDIKLKKDIDFIGKLKTQNEAFTEEVPLTDVIEDEELFNSYPQLKDVKLVFYNYGSHPELTGTGAFSDFTKKVIAIGTENMAATKQSRSFFPSRTVRTRNQTSLPALEMRDVYAYDRESLITNLSRELQHYIQRIEGFAEGTTRDDVIPGSSSYDVYRLSAGEVEARNVQQRIKLTPEERRELMLSETEDVARDQQIVIRREFNRQGSTAPGTELINQISRLSDEFNTPVNVIRTKEDLPGHIKADAKRKGLWNNKIEGVYDSGNVYVVLDALSEDNNDAIMEARKVILHEVVAHKGLPSMLGQEAYDNLLDDIYNSIPEDDKKQLEYEYNTKDKRTIAAEYLANMAENNVNPSLFQRIIAKIREALRWMFNISYSENDIHDMLRRSAKNLRKQGKARPEFAGEYLARQDDISYKTNKPAAQFAGEYLNDPTILQRGAERYQDRKAARSFKESLQGIREYFQDMSLPIRKFEEEVLKRGGKQDNKSKPYRDMFLSFGRMEKLYTDFMEQKMKPVIEAIPPITKTGISGIEILPYIISKHAVERNPVMRGEELRAWVDSHKDATFQEIEDKRESLKDKDYSGVMEFDTKDGKPLGNYTNPDALARDIVAEFEGKVDKALIDNLWAKIGEATRSTLDTWEISKQISPQQKQDYIDKYRFFVPLRGWRDGAAKELVYTRGQGFGKSLRHAEGRKSLADNPLAYIQQVHFQAIGEQVDGEVKEAMLNLVLNNLGNNEIHDLVTIKKLYYMKVPLADGNYEWEPTTTRPPQEMFANGDATTKIYREHERLRTPSQAKEHEVWTNVSKPGGDLVLVFKGEYLSVGQALNRQNYMIRAIWGKILDAREINRLFGVMGHMNNALKAMYTSWNVVFPFTNFMRDFQEASITQYIKLGPRAGKMVVTGYKGAFPAIMRRLAGKPDMNNKMDRDLEDFYNLGGATGYTHNKTIEEIEKEYDRELRGMVRAGTVRGDIANVFRDVFSAINAWNTLFEDATRFSVYLSSIAAGNTREDAAYDAKEASVNFNRKGKGSKAWDAWFAFFNVAIQSLQKNFKLAKDHPGGFTKVAFAWVMLGFLEAVMNAMTDDDDDPDSAYHNINPYMRHNYLLIPNLPRILAKGEKGNKYLSIPLPQFWRGFKSMGALAFDVGTKKAKPKDAVIMALGDFANSLLPIDLGGFYSDGEFSFAPLAPTIVKPAVELAYNRNFMGYTIKKEPFTREQKQLLANSALGKDNVNVAAKFFTDMLYRWSGGESDYRYHIDSKGRTRRVIMDINPSSLEHLFKGYTGGTGGVFSDLISIVAQALDPDEEIDFRDVPFVNKFIRNTPEAKWNIISEYYDLKKENDRDLALMKEYKKKAMETGDTFLYERMATDEYRVRRQQVFDTYEDQIKELTRKEVKDDLETASLAIEMMDYCIGQVKQLDELYRKNRR